MADTPPTDGNNRVTMAVLGVKLDNLSEQVAKLRLEVMDDLSTCKADFSKKTDDHENRLRSLENSQGPAFWRDMAAYAGAAIAGAVAVLTGGKT